MLRLAILDDYLDAALDCADWSQLDDRCEITTFNDWLPAGEALVERLRPFDILCVMRERTPLPRDLLEQLPNLKLVISSGARNASIDSECAAERGIKVLGTTSPSVATPELALGLIIAQARGLIGEHHSFVNGGWQHRLGRDLHGATLGVLGLGRLGSVVAGFGKALGMEVIAWSENLTEARCAEHGVRLVSRDALFAESDFITIHLQLGERTRGLVNAAALSLMKPTAYLVNTSRGPIVDETALVDALTKGTIAGAAIDVFDAEPLPAGHRLRSVPGLLGTPHIGYVTRQTMEVFYRQMVTHVAGFLASRPAG